MVIRRLGYTAIFLPLLLGCTSTGPLLGIVYPDAFDSRYLRLRNLSTGYVVFRVSTPDTEPLTTATLPPGGLTLYEMLTTFGTLCPESIHVDIAAYARANPEQSPLEDMTVLDAPYAAVAVDMQPLKDYGCGADVAWVTIDSTVDCSVLQTDVAAEAISFEAGWVPAQWQTGVQIADPPAPSQPESFPLRGRVVDSSGNPIPDVEIDLPLLQTSVVTDAQGQFSVSLPVGDYLLEPKLDNTTFSPLIHTFTHATADEVPIEFVALPE